MNFMKGSLFHRSTEPGRRLKSSRNPAAESLAVWGSPGCGKTVTAVKIAKHLASQKKECGAAALRYDRPHDALHLPAL